MGKPIPVRLDSAESDIARQMGGGIVSHGVRMALRAVQMAGIEQALAAAASYPSGESPVLGENLDAEPNLEKLGILSDG